MKITGRRLSRKEMETNRYGKPVLPETSLHVNVSHSGKWVVCGVDWQEIGVDVERVAPVEPGIAERFFHPADKEILSCCDEDKKQKLFFTIWTLKESYIKAIGRGLSCSLDSFACIPDGNGEIRLIRGDNGLPEKNFNMPDIERDYVLSVCGSSKPIEIIFLRPEDMISVLKK